MTHRVLRGPATRKLLILETATTAKKAPLPDPLYVYCTKMLSLWSSADTTHWPQYPIDSSGWIEKNTQLPPIQQATDLPLEATPACPSRNFRLARDPPRIDEVRDLKVRGKPCQSAFGIRNT